jgi:hypothetical protein
MLSGQNLTERGNMDGIRMQLDSFLGFDRGGVQVFVVLFVAMISWSATHAEVVEFGKNWGNGGFQLVQQDVSGVEITFSVTKMSVTDVVINGERMQQLGIPGVMLPNDAGAPNLPGMGRFIAIPQGSHAEVRILEVRTEVFHNMEIAPAFEIPAEHDDSPLKFEKDPGIYGVDALYPRQPVTVSDPTSMRGVDVVVVGITPFQYNPVTKDLMVYKDIRLGVDFVGGNGDFGDDRLRSRWWEPVLQRNLLNYESLSEVDFDWIPGTDDTNVEYLIIVPNDPAFIAWADTLKRWRNEQGIITGVTTLTEIGGNNSTLIENYINQACSTWAVPPVAVLLLSDYQSSGDSYGITAPVYNYSYYSCVSDNYYADLDGDDLPDLAIARITAQDNDDLQTMLTKMLSYERAPYTDSYFYSHPVVAGGWQTSRWFILCDEIIYGYMHNVLGKSPVREYAIYSGTPGTSWSTNANTYMIVDYFGPDGLGYIPATPEHLTDWGGNATRMNNDINQGCFIVQHRDHGSVSGWGEPDYGISHLVGLSNTMYPYILSMNCLTGKFDNIPACFTEEIHRMQYGALGVMAASNTSFSFVNDTYTWGVYDFMWPSFDPGYGPTSVAGCDLRPCFANASGKYYLEASNWPYNPQNKADTYYLFHHHGDAFMTLFSEVPDTLTVAHADYVTEGDTTFTVTANWGSLIGLSVNSHIAGRATATGIPTAIPITPLTVGDTLKVVATKVNYRRYAARVPCIPPIIQVPEPIDDLTITRIASHIGLWWWPVTLDTAGNPIEVSYYVVYRCWDDPNFVPEQADSIGVVTAPNTTFLDANALAQPRSFYSVKAVAEN